VFLARVVANELICREHYRLTLALAAFPEARPGQFVHIRCTEPNDLGWTGGAFIRRPFSIGGLRRKGEQVEIDVLHRAIGIGTQWLARLQPGDPINILGPLGQPFRLPEADKPITLLVGGGIGLPPLIWLAEAMQAAGVPSIAFCGARTADLLPLTLSSSGGQSPPDAPASGALTASLFCREFTCFDVPAIVATDDGSLGARGMVPDVLAAWLDANRAEARRAVVYTCGPDRMMRAVAEVCRKHDLPCQVCLERMMACGMGTCQSCVVRIRDEAAAAGWRYRLCCTDGPVFDALDVIWG
jgi:dihydroorotate dehydrogenase electron transfer subunit